jgi:hypothetical protein
VLSYHDAKAQQWMLKTGIYRFATLCRAEKWKLLMAAAVTNDCYAACYCQFLLENSCI